MALTGWNRYHGRVKRDLFVAFLIGLATLVFVYGVARLAQQVMR